MRRWRGERGRGGSRCGRRREDGDDVGEGVDGLIADGGLGEVEKEAEEMVEERHVGEVEIERVEIGRVEKERVEKQRLHF